MLANERKGTKGTGKICRGGISAYWKTNGSQKGKGGPTKEGGQAGESNDTSIKGGKKKTDHLGKKFTKQ